MRDPEHPYGGVDRFGLGTQKPLTVVDSVLVALHESRRAPEVVHETSDIRPSEPEDVPHGSSHFPFVPESVPELLSIPRVPVPPNPVVPPLVHNGAFAALRSICEAEGIPFPTSIDYPLKLCPS